MSVTQLIQQLQTLPPDLEVVIVDNDFTDLGILVEVVNTNEELLNTDTCYLRLQDLSNPEHN
jgi:hypothetical protein